MGNLRNFYIGMRNKWPYTDFHELNADWMIAIIERLIDEVDNFVSQNAIKYADPIQWDILSQYEKNTVVVDPVTGTAYLSARPVPRGVSLSNTYYWSVIFDLGRFITLASQNFAVSYEAVPTTTATVPTDAGAWVVWDSILYQAQNDIHVGDAYVINANIKKKTVEEFFNDLAADLATETQNRIDEDVRIELELRDLVASEANVRASEDSRIELELRDLVASEANIRANDDNTLSGRITDNTNHIGDLSLLGTVTKSNLVGATNEVLGQLGNIGALNTTDKSNAVNAINELLNDISNLNTFGIISEIFKNKKVLILGDSLSVPNTTWSKPFSDFVQSVGGVVDNRAVSGYSIANTLTTVNSLTDSYDICILWVGVNDSYLQHSIGNTVTPGSFAYVYKDVILRLKQLNDDMSIYCFGVSTYIANYLNYNYSIMYYSAAIRAIANTYGCVYKDVLNLMNTGYFDYPALNSDGLHFKQSYSQSWLYWTILTKLSNPSSDTIENMIRFSASSVTAGAGVRIGNVSGYHKIGERLYFNVSIVVDVARSTNDVIFTFSNELKPAVTTWSQIVGSNNTAIGRTVDNAFTTYSALPIGDYVVQLEFTPNYAQIFNYS